MIKKNLFLVTVLVFFFTCIGSLTWSAQAPLRFLKPKYEDKKPAIVLVAFGTSTKAQVTFDHIDAEIKKEFPDYEIRWAFTSKIIRDKMNKIYAKKNINKKLHSLQEVLATLEAEGFRKAVVQSLHIFPGGEYVHMQHLAQIPGIRVSIGEPLLATWEDVLKLLEEISQDFPNKDEGCAVLAGHGTPNTYYAPSTAVYLALDRLLQTHYPNVFLGSVEGVPDRKDALDKAKAYPGKKVRMIPFMLVAGDHIMNDIMGNEPDDEGTPSWAMELRAAGKEVDCPTITIDGKTYLKGLGFFPATTEIITEHIHQALKDLK